MKNSSFLASLAAAVCLGASVTAASAQVRDRAAERSSVNEKRAPALAQQDTPPAPQTPKARTPKRAPSSFDDSSKATIARVKFSDPSKPGTLKFSLPWAEVRIEGTEGDEVVVASSLQRKTDKKDVDADGFRRLDDDVSFELVEKNNVVGLSIVGDQHWMSHGAEFRIQVPRNTNLIVRTQAGGDIRVSNIDGDIDVNSMNGEVRLTDIGASAVVNTMNGEVTAVFRQMPTKPVSITSMNGEIDVSLPAETKANIRLRTHNGSVRTNFSEERLATKSETSNRRVAPAARVVNAEDGREIQREVADAVREAQVVAREVHESVRATAARSRERGESAAPPAPPLPPVTFPGGKSITGTLNGGGVDISLSTMNGTITLREIKD